MPGLSRRSEPNETVAVEAFRRRLALICGAAAGRARHFGGPHDRDFVFAPQAAAAPPAGKSRLFTLSLSI
jgi:hypothetical protein